MAATTARVNFVRVFIEAPLPAIRSDGLGRQCLFSSGIPHLGHFPGPAWTTSGCIGHVYRIGASTWPDAVGLCGDGVAAGPATVPGGLTYQPGSLRSSSLSRTLRIVNMPPIPMSPNGPSPAIIGRVFGGP